ncbi:uncharacterized protein LOC131805061 [Musca domestica]|uniref:Uncharacterized protein LOC131805061 n=1 Tax=Musca domestica TaxID=7370 RepID=A0ABM3VER3_MUSDO|nr:uncharacterized protein LOC131805061 [Musca domestica]
MAAYLPNQEWEDDEEVRPPNRRQQQNRPQQQQVSPNRRQQQNRPQQQQVSPNRRISESQQHQRRRQQSRSRSGQRESRRERPSFWQYSCGLCQDDHAINTCPRFREQTPYQRYETVERRGYCRNCLARSHLAPDCTCLTGCRRCDHRHHTLLHGAPQLDNTLQPAPIVIPPFSWDLVFVPTALVRVASEGVDTWKTVRALICQSASMSKIAYSAFQRLGLRSFIYRNRRFAAFKIMARNPNNTWALKVNALISDDLPRKPYSHPLLEDLTSYFTQQALADPDPRSNIPIDLELGADTYSVIRQDGCTPAGIGDVQAFQTKLGYVFSGPIKNMPTN